MQGNESIYDPENYDTFYANEYGGFGTGKGHGARPGGFSQPRGPPPMAMRNRGGPRGGGMGRGGGRPIIYTLEITYLRFFLYSSRNIMTID